MHMISLNIALLLSTGLMGGKLCQRFHIPSVTGYILAGLLLGPSFFHIVNKETIGHNLDHFTTIANIETPIKNVNNIGSVSHL
ncbi:MAG: hypothetical protein GY737_11995 [Desulfobacteraceae bacterium]|nr:hypothetical protein [Desulfobacteraceae bacterium]